MASILERKKPWLQAAVIVGIAVAVLAAATIYATRNEEAQHAAERPPVERGDEPPTIVDETGEPLPQAAWKIGVFPSTVGRPTKAQRRIVAKHRDKLNELVREVTDAIVLRGSTEGVRGRLSAPAADRLERSKLLLPEGMGAVETLRRRARVGVDRKAAHAAAEVVVAFKGTLAAKQMKLLQRTTLWLERGPKGWKVIAFSGERKRLG